MIERLEKRDKTRGKEERQLVFVKLCCWTTALNIHMMKKRHVYIRTRAREGGGGKQEELTSGRGRVSERGNEDVKENESEAEEEEEEEHGPLHIMYVPSIRDRRKRASKMRSPPTFWPTSPPIRKEEEEEEEEEEQQQQQLQHHQQNAY